MRFRRSLLSALRELIITARAAGINPRQRYKLANLVLAAPDLDLSVVSQRMVAERIGLAIDEITLYSSPADKAIGIAERLFASPRGRLGTLDISEISETEAKILEANAERITVVNFKGEAQGYGHSYFRTNPAVSSDLVLRLRYGFEAGTGGSPTSAIWLRSRNIRTTLGAHRFVVL